MATSEQIAPRLEALMERRGFNPRSLAIAAGLNPTGVRDILIHKVRAPRHETLAKIATILDTTVSDLTGDSDASIAVVARVGAGAEVAAIDDHVKGDGLYHVRCPHELPPHGVVGVEVQGDSMFPAYDDGDVLFFSREVHGVPDEAVGRNCICVDEAGNGWIKRLKRGSAPGLFNLISLNPAADNRFDVRLIWAAPVRLHWPADLVEKV